MIGSIGSQAAKNTIDVDIEAMLVEGHPVLARYVAFKEQFGRDDLALIALEPGDPFDPDFLEQLNLLHRRIEDEVPYVDEVTSLVNARVTRGEADELIVEDLFEEWPPSEERLRFAREYATTAPFYQNLLLSRDGKVTTVRVEFSAYVADGGDALEGFEESEAASEEPVRLSGVLRNEAMRVLGTILADVDPGLNLMIAGMPIVAQRSGDLTVQAMARFTATALVGIFLVLILLFRRASGALLPLAIGLLTIVATFGISGIRGQPLNITAQVLPTLLLSVNISSSIHLVFMFFKLFDAGASREQAVRGALGHSALPVVFANLTTAGGLLSFLGAELGAVRDIGLLAPTGIVLGMILSLTLLPALLAVLPVRRKQSSASVTGGGRIEQAIVAAGALSARRPVATVVACLIIAGAAIAGAHRLHITFYPVEFVGADDLLVHWTKRFNERFDSGVSLEMVLDTGRENGLHDPALLARLDGLYDHIPELRGGPDGEIRVGKAISFVDILKEIHKALNENRDEFYTVPDDRQLAAQELLLFENSGSDDLEEFVDSQFSVMRFTLLIPFVGGEKYTEIVPATLTLFREQLPPDVDVQVTGALHMFVTMVSELRSGSISSYLMAFVIITPLMMLLIGSFRAGLASMLPNMLPIAMAIGMLGWVSGEFSLFTMLVGGIAIGLAVDDTIHVFYQYQRYRRELGSSDAAVAETMRTTGLALLTTTVVLSIGFLVYATSEMRTLQWMGGSIACAIVLAFLADVFLGPALLTLIYRKRDRPGAAQSEVAGS